MQEKKKTKHGLEINWEFSRLASEEQIQRTVRALEENGIHTLVAQHGEEA